MKAILKRAHKFSSKTKRECANAPLINKKKKVERGQRQKRNDQKYEWRIWNENKGRAISSVKDLWLSVGQCNEMKKKKSRKNFAIYFMHWYHYNEWNRRLLSNISILCSPNELSMLEFKYVKMYDHVIFFSAGGIEPNRIEDQYIGLAVVLCVICKVRTKKNSCVIYYPETIMHWVRYESIIN